MNKESYGANMLLFTTYWGQTKTFKLMPVSSDCPYMEVIYDPTVEMLVAMSKTMKENFEMLPRVDDDGEWIPTKRPKKNGKPMKEQRVLVHVPTEFYMVERSEQEAFIESFAVNAKDFDYKKHLDAKPAGESQILQEQKPEAGAILDKEGKVLSVAK